MTVEPTAVDDTPRTLGRDNRASWLAATSVLIALAWTVLSHPPSAFALFENTWLRALLLGLALSLWLGREPLVRMAGVPSRAEGWALAAIVLLGTVLRFGVTAVPFHADSWMRFVWRRVAAEPEPGLYGNGYGVFMRLFLLPGLDPEQAIFTANRIVGSLIPAAAYATTRTLVRNPRTALWAALLVALTPVLVRLSASEGMHPIPIAMTLVAVIGFRGHAHLGSRALLFTGVTAFSYAVLTRPDAVVTAAALPFAYAPTGDRARIRDPWLAGSVVVAIAAGVPMVVPSLGIHTYPTPAHVAWETFTSSLNLAGPPHGACALIGAVGLFALVDAGDGWGALLILVAIAARIEMAGFETNAANRLQLLSTELPWIALSAAAMPGLLLDHLPRASPLRAIACALMLGLIVFATAHAPFLRVRWGLQQEWLFIERAVPIARTQVPGLPLVRAVELDGAPHILNPQPLPDYEFPDRDIHPLKDLLTEAVHPPALYFRGLNCYDFDLYWDVRTPTPVANPGQREPPIASCAEVESRYNLTPIVTSLIDGPSYWRTDPAPVRQVGFFKLTDKAPP